MKRRSLFFGFDFLQSITLNAQDFITEWTFNNAAIKKRINALTMGTVIYNRKASHSDYIAGEYGTSALAARKGLINNQGCTIPGDSPSTMPCSLLLPVELLCFTATQIKKHVFMYRKRTSGINHHFYEIEHCLNCIRYYTIGEIPGQGTTQELRHYHFFQDRPSAGINYYRIKKMDFDGQFSYSEVTERNVQHDSPVKIMTIVPNPVARCNVFKLHGIDSGKEIKMYNVQGQEVQIQKVSDRQENIINVPSGIYYINDNQHGRFSKIVVVELLGNQFITIKSSVK